jgi:hypothetical protein
VRIIINRTDTNLFFYIITDVIKDDDIKTCATSRSKKNKLASPSLCDGKEE